MDNTIVILLVLGLVPVALFFGYLQSERRRAALARAAPRCGMRFNEHADYVPDVLSHFELFSQGRRRRACNLLMDASDDEAFWIFDYQYTIRGGRRSRTVRQTVAAFPYLNANLPAFALRREHLGHKLASVFGFNDIDFPEDPSFSSRYWVRGKDESSVRRLYDANVIGTIDGVERICLEGGGSCLLVYREGKLVEPESISAFFDQARRIADAFVARCEKMGWKQQRVLHDTAAAQPVEAGS